MALYFVDGLQIAGESERFIQEVLVRGEYEPLFNYDTVVDVGANIGSFSIWVYPHAQKIYAVEPNPKAMRHLQQTVRDNKLDKIIPCEVAITGSTGTRLLDNTDTADYGSGVINDSQGLTVQSMTLEAFVREHDIDYIDLLKIDVEGCEREIVEEKGFADVSKRIGTIIGEYHNGLLNEYVGEVLTGYGFRYTDLTKGGASGKFIARKQ